MDKIISSIPDAPASKGNGIVIFLVSTTVLAAVGYSVYDYYEHGQRSWWARLKTANELRQLSGEPKKGIIQQFFSLFETS